MFLLKIPRPDSAVRDPTVEVGEDVQLEFVGEFATVQEALDEAMEHHVDETAAVIEDSSMNDRRTVMAWRDAAQLA